MLAEGFAMLRSIVSDFKSAGHQITILLDSRISKFNPPINADFIVPVFDRHEILKFFETLLRINDAAYVIAPESGRILESLVQFVEETGKISLNCQSHSIERVADKSTLYKALKENGLTYPETAVLKFGNNLEETKKYIKSMFNYPLILKPSDGVGCSGLSFVEDESQIETAIAKIKLASENQEYIIQDFIKGEAASISLLCSGYNAFSVSLNGQSIKISLPNGNSIYEGGIVPFEHPLKQIAFKVAEKIGRSFPGLRGFIGVDLVLTENNVFVIEVNPRLTTSYVGLRETTNYNFAEGIIDSVLNKRLPTESETHGVTCFAKIETTKPTINALQETNQIIEVISPPFPLINNSNACSLVAAHGKSSSAAQNKLEKAKKNLLEVVKGRK